MAKKRVCKWRKAYFISERCARCKNRRKCGIKILHKWTCKAAKVAGCIAIFIVIVAFIDTLSAGKNHVIDKDHEVGKTEVIEMADASYTTEKMEEAEEKTFEETSETLEKSAPLESITIRRVASEEEKMAMGKVVWKEARGEPYEGKVAVAAVILNRVDTADPNFGAENENILSVISYPGAFASIEGFSDSEFKQTEEYEDCMKAVDDALNGSDPTKVYFENGALFFYSLLIDLVPEEAARREKVDTHVIGNHAFHVKLN